jgi:demethylmenaquinone methyltransferase/2-methoxy-6-polyprenyl-1,4-benzoquinol methylase
MLGEASQLAVPLVRAIGERLPFADASFDFVSMGFALRHVSDLDALFGEIRRVLKPGGSACILELTAPESRWVAVPLRIFMTRVVPAMALVRRPRAQARALMQFFWDTVEACVRPETVMGALERAGIDAPRRLVVLGLFSEYTGKRK